MRDKVEALLREFVTPLVAADGGAIELVEVRGDTVVLRLLKACGGCPGAHYTRTRVIEPVLRRELGARIQVTLERGGPAPA